MSCRIYDIHVHLPDPVAFCRYARTEKMGLFMRVLVRRLRNGTEKLTPEAIEDYNQKVIKRIESSILDRAIILALDNTYDESGRVAGEFTCSNEYIYQLCRTNNKLMFGASIHPYRKNGLDLLQECIENGAVLVKWLPSFQNIDLEDVRCLPFYEMLSANKIPLLCHTGNEHILGNKNDKLNNPAKLTTALKKGVTVIAAHCGARLMLHEKSYFKIWQKMALEFEKCYGDISAFILPTRIHLLKKIRNDKDLCSKVLFGSDFPGISSLNSCFFQLGYSKVNHLRKENNEFSRTVRILQELGFPDSVFSRAGEILRVENTC